MNKKIKKHYPNASGFSIELTPTRRQNLNSQSSFIANWDRLHSQYEKQHESTSDRKPKVPKCSKQPTPHISKGFSFSFTTTSEILFQDHKQNKRKSPNFDGQSSFPKQKCNHQSRNQDRPISEFIKPDSNFKSFISKHQLGFLTDPNRHIHIHIHIHTFILWIISLPAMSHSSKIQNTKSSEDRKKPITQTKSKWDNVRVTRRFSDFNGAADVTYFPCFPSIYK